LDFASAMALRAVGGFMPSNRAICRLRASVPVVGGFAAFKTP
jgi:hypothetical protein